MPHRDTSVAIQKAIKQCSKCHSRHKPSNKLYLSILNDRDDPPGYINTGFEDHYLAVISTEL